eukprot:453877_1
MMEQEGGTKLASIETGDTFQNALPNDILSSCDEKNDWWYKTVSDYWAGSVERGTPFLVTFTGKTSNEKEYFEQALRRHFEQIDSFPRAKADFSSKLYIDIGEAYEPNEKGQCLKPKTMLHVEHHKCVFFPRMDTVPHYGLTGGYEGFKEGATKLQARVSLFIKHDFHAYNRIYKPLFEAKPYTNAIRNICPLHRPYVNPVEISLTLQLPGQGLLSHHDAVYFAPSTKRVDIKREKLRRHKTPQIA